MLRRWWPVCLDWLLLVGWMAVIFYLSDQSHPAVPGVEIGLIRKLMHVGEYVVLFVLWLRALHLSLRWDGQRTMRIALLATVMYAISDEAHQLLVAGRDGNALDVLIDGALPFGVWLRTEVR